MKKFLKDFLLRGLVACGFGPIVLAVFYLILYHQGVVETLTVEQVCRGIFSLYVLAFIAGGTNAIHQIERIPLAAAILLHGGVLYVCYLGTYLFNDWLERDAVTILVFTGIFLLVYLMIWAVIYGVTRKNTEKLNQMLKEKQKQGEL